MVVLSIQAKTRRATGQARSSAKKTAEAISGTPAEKSSRRRHEQRLHGLGSQKATVTQIVPGDNDRQTFEPLALQDLSRSIHRDGLIQPITVRAIFECPDGHLSSEVGFRTNDGKTLIPCGTYWCDECERLYGSDWDLSHYQIVAGERRFRAVADLLKWEPSRPLCAN